MIATPARRRPRALRATCAGVLLAALVAGAPEVARAEDTDGPTPPATSAWSMTATPAPAPTAEELAAVDGEATDTPADDPATADGGTETATPRTRPRARFQVASFNVLGTRHTRGSRERLNGTRRARLAARWLRGEGTSLIGMSEAQRDQMRVLVERNGWASYPRWETSRDNDTAQSVVWRPRVWRRVRAHRYRIPFNHGRSRWQPVVLLEHRASHRRIWVVATHLQTGRTARDRRERRAGATRLVREVRRIHRSGRRMLVLGDLNSHDAIFCRLSRDTALEAPQGGSVGTGRCRPPPPRLRRVDWIFGSPGFEWSGFRVAESRVLQQITDHDVPVSTVLW